MRSSITKPLTPIYLQAHEALGKTSAAKIFAKAINCPNRENGEPCNQCEICQQITEGSLNDVIEIDAASNNGVEEIRDIREKVKYAPTQAPYKVYIIDEVHMLSTGAFNALLKTLEEPPKMSFLYWLRPSHIRYRRRLSLEHNALTLSESERKTSSRIYVRF